MTFWGVVFVVLMLFWLVLGCYVGRRDAGSDLGPLFGHTLIPWACVAILGYILLGGGR